MNTDLECLGDQIAELSAHLDAATARLLDLIREFDSRGGWGNGFSSCAAWLTWRVGLDPGAARERVRVARALGRLPRPAQALARGELSYSKLLVETALHHGVDPGAPGERYQVVVHVDAPVMADPDASGQSVLEDGAHVCAETSRRLACDASRVVMRQDADGRVTEVGARGRGPFRPRYDERSSIATAAAAFRAADCRLVKGITSATGPMAAPPRSRISRCSVAGITVRSTKRVTR